MQTIVLTEPGRLSLTETPPPAGPGPGEAIVRVHRIGVCGTDLHRRDRGGRIVTTSWISQLASLEEAVDRFGDWTRSETGVIKAMIRLG